jgi:hypothetical protein
MAKEHMRSSGTNHSVPDECFFHLTELATREIPSSFGVKQCGCFSQDVVDETVRVARDQGLTAAGKLIAAMLERYRKK